MQCFMKLVKTIIFVDQLLNYFTKITKVCQQICTVHIIFSILTWTSMRMPSWIPNHKSHHDRSFKTPKPTHTAKSTVPQVTNRTSHSRQYALDHRHNPFTISAARRTLLLRAENCITPRAIPTENQSVRLHVACGGVECTFTRCTAHYALHYKRAAREWKRFATAKRSHMNTSHLHAQ